MAKGNFETKPEGDGKIITINFDLGNNKTHKIKIKKPRTGGPTEWEGIDGPFENPGVDLNHPPDDTMIITDTNPKCAYYYWNGKWYYR